MYTSSWKEYTYMSQQLEICTYCSMNKPYMEEMESKMCLHCSIAGAGDKEESQEWVSQTHVKSQRHPTDMPIL